MRRRHLLAAAAALPASLAGCAGVRTQNAVAELPTASLEMRPVDDADLPGRVLYSAGDSDSERGRLLRAAADGSTTVEGVRPLLPEGRQIAGPDGVYELDYEVTERTPATAFSVKIDIVEGTVVEERAVRFGDLPAVDRETFAERGFDEGEVVGIGTTLLYTDDEAERSELVPESPYDYIVWANGNEAEWVVDDGYDQTLKTYRYTGERVDSLAGYGERMRERFAFDLGPLPDEEREIVEQAVEDGFVVGPEETPTPEFESLVERFRGKPDIHGLQETPDDDAAASGRYLMRYDGEVYLTRLDYNPEGETAASVSAQPP